jgi:hypothetical protein
MSVDERRRNALFNVLVDRLGEESAVTMFELLPPPSSDLATQQHVDLRFDLVDERFEAIDQRFDAIDRRFDAIDRRFEVVDRRFDGIEQHLATRFDEQRRVLDARLDGVRDELLAAFRGELVTAVSGQTRAVIVATATATFGIGGLAVTLAQLL